MKAPEGGPDGSGGNRLSGWVLVIVTICALWLGAMVAASY